MAKATKKKKRPATSGSFKAGAKPGPGRPAKAPSQKEWEKLVLSKAKAISGVKRHFFDYHGSLTFTEHVEVMRQLKDGHGETCMLALVVGQAYQMAAEGKFKPLELVASYVFGKPKEAQPEEQGESGPQHADKTDDELLRLVRSGGNE
jgi:hypothetical protein